MRPHQRLRARQLPRLPRWIAPTVVALPLVALALLPHLRPSSPSPAAEERTSIAPLPTAPLQVPEEVELDLPRVDRLIALGGSGACALGGRKIICSEDGGVEWQLQWELSSRPLIVARSQDGSLLTAAEDGAIFRLVPSEAPRKLAAPFEDRSLVDGQAKDGLLFLLVHRFDHHADPLRLPTVRTTEVLEVDARGEQRLVATARGFAGDRLLLQPSGGLITFASVDARAWRTSGDEMSLRRIPDSSRFGASYGGLQVAVERRTDRLPGRQARPASALHVSRDGGESWDHVFDTTGEILVDFADERTGLVVAQGEGAAWRTDDGGEGFELVDRDDRLRESVAVTHAGERFLIATSRPSILLISP